MGTLKNHAQMVYEENSTIVHLLRKRDKVWNEITYRARPPLQ